MKSKVVSVMMYKLIMNATDLNMYTYIERLQLHDHNYASAILEDKRTMATATGSKGALLPGYVELLVDLRSKERYRENLKFSDLYEIPKET